MFGVNVRLSWATSTNGDCLQFRASVRTAQKVLVADKALPLALARVVPVLVLRDELLAMLEGEMLKQQIPPSALVNWGEFDQRQGVWL